MMEQPPSADRTASVQHCCQCAVAEDTRTIELAIIDAALACACAESPIDSDLRAAAEKYLMAKFAARSLDLPKF